MFGISIRPPRLPGRHARKAADRGLHRAESLRESLPEAHEVRDAIDGALEELRDQAMPMLQKAQPMVEKAQPMVQKALGRKRRRSRKPLLLLVLLAAGAAVAYFLWNRRDEEPAYLAKDPDQPNVTPDASPSPGGDHATIPGRPDVTTGTIPSAAPSMPRPVVMPTGSSPAPVSAPPPATSPNPVTSPAPVNGSMSQPHGSQPQSHFYGAAPSGQQQSRGPAAWDLPSSGGSIQPR